MGKLTEKVERKIAEVESRPDTALRAELQRAWELSDLYEDLKPREYILPLDALAGFCYDGRRRAAEEK